MSATFFAVPVRLCTSPDLRLHPKIPLIPLLTLVHLGVAFLTRVLRRRRRVDDYRIHDRPFFHEQLPLTEQLPHFRKDLSGQIIHLQKVAEL